MNIENHFNTADTYLIMANQKVSSGDFIGARAALAQARNHTLELLDHVGKLEASKANIELSDEGD